MRYRTAGWIILAFIPTLMSGCAQPQVEVSPFSAQDAAAVRTNLDTFMGADPIDAAETFFSQFTEDVYWIYRGEHPWVGMQGLRTVNWCHIFSGEITADRVEGSGDLAYARGTYRLSLDCEGFAPVYEGVFLSTHRRQQDGAWRIESLLQPE